MTEDSAGDSAAESLTSESIDWSFLTRVAVKAAVVFALLNAAFAACRPLDQLGRLSLYHQLLLPRPRLSYGEVPARDNNLTLNNLPAMLAAHEISRPKADDEFRVLLLGDSGTWGWLLDNQDTLAGGLNAQSLQTPDGRRVVVYNLGYPVMSLTKDLMLLDAAMAYQPDLILWPVTLQSFARGRQLDHPLLQNNAGRVRELIRTFGLDLDAADERFVDRTFLQETLVGRRRDLADLLRLQTLGFAWTATGIDQAIPETYEPRSTDLAADLSWLDIAAPRPLTREDLSFDILAAGVERAGSVPVIIINEPMFISDGANSDLRYNAFYPRWAYDDYRRRLAETAAAAGWNYLDLWDAIDPAEFTDTPVHLTPAGTRELADILAGVITQAVDSGAKEE